jgi:hypothetical protein
MKPASNPERFKTGRGTTLSKLNNWDPDLQAPRHLDSARADQH